jgi:cobalt-precorrin-5B (C1)-methyltransferase
MLDMGDFSGGLLKYLRRHPTQKLTIGGGIGKITKLAQGAKDLHSKRSQVDFKILHKWSTKFNLGEIENVNTALEALEICGPKLAEIVAKKALARINEQLLNSNIICDVVIIDRAGKIVGRAF